MKVASRVVQTCKVVVVCVLAVAVLVGGCTPSRESWRNESLILYMPPEFAQPTEREARRVNAYVAKPVAVPLKQGTLTFYCDVQWVAQPRARYGSEAANKAASALRDVLWKACAEVVGEKVPDGRKYLILDEEARDSVEHEIFKKLYNLATDSKVHVLYFQVLAYSLKDSKGELYIRRSPLW